MAFVVRRPFALTLTLKQLPKTTKAPLRAFHQASRQSTTSTSTFNKPSPLLSQARHAFSKRSYNTPSANYANPAASGNLTQRLLYGATLVGGGILATNLVFNRETREDGGMPPFERQYLNDTFMHTGLGLGMIGVAATALHRSGWSYRLMSMSPWVVVGGGLVLSIGSMLGTRMVAPENYVPKYALWSVFNVSQALVLSPLLFLQPALLARAGLYTVAMMGSISFVGATAKQEKYLWLGGPLLAGCALVAVSGFAPLLLPATATRTLMWTENIWLYGGLAVFGGFTLWDTQKILHHARLAERGFMKKDPVNESISLELDFLNIFIRMVQILGLQNRKR
ncbi:uncharacterized protein KY384_001390 [Bacidia gigantensis]|uniref:uncharacterized protein n=1 Tax=Bacidia gigantensis TaxID=2732470 RepID=UPI001D047DFB|nr:uncharacterized protein KY384_001390 [Bacidia gigantensis]KAG8533649.1 hypothetical protein KY384_001390 [Bacidia gigantensis]